MLKKFLFIIMIITFSFSTLMAIDEEYDINTRSKYVESTQGDDDFDDIGNLFVATPVMFWPCISCLVPCCLMSCLIDRSIETKNLLREEDEIDTEN